MATREVELPNQPLRHAGGGTPQDLHIVGPLIQVILCPDLDDAAAMRAAGREVISASASLMIDTGALHTVVEKRVADGLRINPVRYEPIVGVSQKPEMCPIYQMTILIDVDTEIGVKCRFRQAFTADVAGVPHPQKDLPHVGLLGRDFLSMVKLIYDGPRGRYEIIDSRHVRTAPPSSKKRRGK